jgi:hypothetical protein
MREHRILLEQLALRQDGRERVVHLVAHRHRNLPDHRHALPLDGALVERVQLL